MRPGPTLFILIETLGILSFAFSALINVYGGDKLGHWSADVLPVRTV